MPAHTSNRIVPIPAEDAPIAAGDFSTWLAHARAALIDGEGTNVACGDCVGCCSSSYFIHVRPAESRVLPRLARELLAPAPGMGGGDRVLGYDARGRCPMLSEHGCAIYADRPRTCRAYDCRLFAAAGILAGGDDKAAINQRIARWRFAYPTARDRQEQRAVKAAATFVRTHAKAFPGGRVPVNPSQLAVLAIKVYEVFAAGDGVSPPPRPSSAELAQAVIAACRRFDARMAEFIAP